MMPDKLTEGIEKYKVKSLTKQYFFQEKLQEVPPPGGSAPVYLVFDMQHQLRTFWCWAASSVSVSLFYDKSSKWTQCLVAEDAFGGNCCQDPRPCDQSWYLHEALKITGNFVDYSGPLSFAEVKSELLAGKVIGCRIEWIDKGGHFIVMHGCKTIGSTTYFNVDDPIYGKSEIPENAFLNAYQGSGTWTHSFITKP